MEETLSGSGADVLLPHKRKSAAGSPRELHDDLSQKHGIDPDRP